MKIETKYNVGQEVWFIEDDKVKSDDIVKIQFTENSNGSLIVYWFQDRTFNTESWERFKMEEDVFATKEEKIKLQEYREKHNLYGNIGIGFLENEIYFYKVCFCGNSVYKNNLCLKHYGVDIKNKDGKHRIW